ncbi:MAG: hypothetical protein FWC77_02460 [Defluviitaleaceae bacterium]|nr:hypothetical protein [Defluviitaleaceae bacterium]
MSLFSLYRVELKRLALSKFAWAALILSLCTPLLGYITPLSNPEVVTGQFIANPVLTGTIYGGIIWGLLTILESNRIHRAGAGMLIDAIASPISMALVRVAALITLAAGTAFAAALMYLPYTIVSMGSLFSLGLYIISFLVLLVPTWWISVLLAAAIGQIARRVEIAGLLYAAAAFFSLSAIAFGDLFVTWLNPIVLTFSDGFSSLFYLRIAFYSRLIWLALSGGLWVFSLLCIRRYQKNLAGSFFHGIRKAYLPISAAALIAAGVFLWLNQPFVDHGPVEFNFGGEHTVSGNTSISGVSHRLTPRPATGRLHGIAEYSAAGGSGNSGLYIVWLNAGYRILSIEYDGRPVEFTLTDEIEADARRTDFTLAHDNWSNLRIEYEGFPTMIRAFAPNSWGNEINRTNITLSNAGSVPMVTGFSHPGSYNLELVLPGNMVPVVNHRLMTDYTRLTCGTKVWTGYIEGFGLRLNAADYIVESFTAADMYVDFIFARAYEDIMREFEIPGAIGEVLDFFTDILGPLHWAHLPSLSMLQSSALMFGGIAGDGFVEWGESIFTVHNLDNPLQGSNAAEVFVHEMVHMWWGGLGVSSGWGGDGEVWSDEGLTVYYTYRFFKHKYGEENAQRIVDAWKEAVDRQERCFYFRNPEYFDRLPEVFRAQLNARNRGTNLYARMPLMILRAEELLGGPEKMDELMRQVQQDFAGNGPWDPFTFQHFLDAVGLLEEDLRLG